MLGPAQFSRRLRIACPGLHRWKGRIYVLGCTAGRASGFLLAAGASTGVPTVLGLGSLALVWPASTKLAWYRAL